MQNISFDQAILVAVNPYSSNPDVLDELEHLALALNIKTKDKFVQCTTKISPKTYVGSGKALEIKKAVEVLNCDLVIFDDTLSPAQLKNLESLLEVQVIDRSFLILSIFANRAQSKSSVLEVSLAQKLYMLPRLVGLSNSLSRQGGGSYNAKGPGETKLELDRRKILNDIVVIRQKLEKFKQEKQISRQKRMKNNIPIVALVGYTNAGKSSLMNSISNYLEHDSKDVFVKNMLFATLDTKSKLLHLKNNMPFLLIDTVGFVSRLPHELVASFESTLSDVLDADLILHVVDGAFYNPLHIATTKQVLTHLNANHIEQMMVFTKKEIALSPPSFEGDYHFVSNHTLENIDTLVADIYRHLYESYSLYQLHIPFDKLSFYNELKTHVRVLETIYDQEGYQVKALLNDILLEKYNNFVIKKAL